MLFLRIEYRRANVAAFWLVGSATLFLIVGMAASALGSAAPWSIAASIVVALVLPGLAWRSWFERGVWLWNGCVRRLVAALCAYILRVTYVLLLGPLGASRPSLDLGRSQVDPSGWTERRYIKDSQGPGSQEAARHDLAAFVQMPGNRWATVLFPLVLLLAMLRDTNQEATPPGSTYTLY
jgi:hypothetical protein